MAIMEYYTTGITACGYKSLLINNLKGIEQKIYVQSNVDEQALIKKILLMYNESEYDMEYIYNPYQPESYEAIINTTLNKAIIFNADIRKMPLAKGKITKEFDLYQMVTEESFKNKKKMVQMLEAKCTQCIQIAYSFLKAALKVYKQWEDIYIKNMDFNKANNLSKKLIAEIIGEKKTEKKAIIKTRFLGATTPDGAKNYIAKLTSNVGKRYFLKGRPGTGKSTVLKSILKVAKKHGYDIEVYYCGFDPKSMDMIIIRELGVAIFDATSPHELSPKSKTDVTIDMYKEAVTPNTDEKFANEIEELSMKYDINISVATQYLKTMSHIHNQIKHAYSQCFSEEEVKKYHQEIINFLSI